MSGPKDFQIVLSQLRQEQIASLKRERLRRREEALQRRAAANRQILAEAMRKLADQLVQIRQLQKQSETGRASQPCDENGASQPWTHGLARQFDTGVPKENGAQVNETAGFPKAADIDSPASLNHSEISSFPESQTLFLSSNDRPTSHDARIADKPSDSPERQLIFDAMNWREELLADEDVRDFQREESAQWLAKCRQVLDSTMEFSPKDLHKALEILASQAKELHAKAGELAAKFNARNELLKDIIESLKEVGFVVEDPQLAHADRPSGEVLLIAVRGKERFQANIELTDEVRSTWDGVSEEHCKTAFFDYVDAMERNGVTVIPKRADLQDRPTLRQQDAKTIPILKSQNA